MGKHIKLSVISLFQPGDRPSLRVLQTTDPDSEVDVSVFSPGGSSGHENTHPNRDCTSLALCTPYEHKSRRSCSSSRFLMSEWSRLWRGRVTT